MGSANSQVSFLGHKVGRLSRGIISQVPQSLHLILDCSQVTSRGLVGVMGITKDDKSQLCRF